MFDGLDCSQILAAPRVETMDSALAKMNVFVLTFSPALSATFLPVCFVIVGFDLSCSYSD
jgi:hypothetical protein